ncbi:MAG: HDIG domain-containing protein [Bacteroidales bacterium]|nr:HDIG domain-containing protein [Bacteroidales bacterium]
MTLSRSEALNILYKYIKNKKLIYHSKSSEAVMRALAKYLSEDVDKWGITGLLHDIDAEITNNDMKIHGLKAKEILKEYDIDEEIIEAIIMHNEEATGKERITLFQHALAAGETVTGLIYATALVYPDKKIASVKYKSVIKRMKQKAFAASVKRENIMECEKIGVPLEDFIKISVDAMCEIGDEIGL